MSEHIRIKVTLNMLDQARLLAISYRGMISFVRIEELLSSIPEGLLELLSGFAPIDTDLVVMKEGDYLAMKAVYIQYGSRAGAEGIDASCLLPVTHQCRCHHDDEEEGHHDDEGGCRCRKK